MDKTIIDWKKYGEHTKIDCFNTMFKNPKGSNRIQFKINAFNCNGVDIYQDSDRYTGDLFNLVFNHDLPDFESGYYKDIELDAENEMLIINNSDIYKLINSDVLCFSENYNAKDEDVRQNLLSHLVEDIQKNYVRA